MAIYNLTTISMQFVHCSNNNKHKLFSLRKNLQVDKLQAYSTIYRYIAKRIIQTLESLTKKKPLTVFLKKLKYLVSKSQNFVSNFFRVKKLIYSARKLFHFFKT